MVTWIVKLRGTEIGDGRDLGDGLCSVVETLKHHTAHHAWQLSSINGSPPFYECEAVPVKNGDLRPHMRLARMRKFQARAQRERLELATWENDGGLLGGTSDV